MGFFTKIKKIFKKTVEVGKNSDNHVVSLSKTTGKITLNKFLVVPQGYEAFLVAKEKVCDRFTSGEHKLTLNSLPLTTRVLKLNIPSKKGKYKNTFNADVYFINLKEFKNQKFKSFNGVYIKKDKEFLGFYVNLIGTYSYEVSRPELLLEALLNTYGMIKNNVAQRQIDNWTAVSAEKKIEKNKPSAEQIYERETECFTGVIETLNRQLSDIGIKYTSFEVTQTLLPKRIYKKVKLSFDENVEEKVDNNSTSLVLKGRTKISVNERLSVKEEKKSKTRQQESLIPFESNLFEEHSEEFKRDEISNQENDSTDTTASSVTFSDTDMSAYNEIEEKGYLIEQIAPTKQEENNMVDVDNIVKSDVSDEYHETPYLIAENEDELQETEIITAEKEDKPANQNKEEETIKRKVGFKTCQSCGAVNTKSAKKCFKCEVEFVKNCEKCGAKIKEGEFVCPKCKSIVI